MPLKILIKGIYKIIAKKLQIPLSLLNVSLKIISLKRHEIILKSGYCPLCGKNNIMIIRNIILKESGECLLCSASSRYKAVAELIKRIILIIENNKNLDFNMLRNRIEKINLTQYALKSIINNIKSDDLWIYEPSSRGAIYNVLRDYSKFINSEYFPYSNLKLGDYYKGTRFEDLHCLTFKDNSFDLIISLDVFEHVRDPMLAFKEIHRVLRKKGIHIFTVPLENREKTINRIDKNNTILIKPTVYHADNFRTKRPIVYNDWGYDIIEYLKDLRFSSFFFSIKNKKNGIFCEVKIIVSKMKN